MGIEDSDRRWEPPGKIPVGTRTLDRKERNGRLIITRLHVDDYDAWRALFDEDRPRAREKATVKRLFRGVEDTGQVFVMLEFASVEDATESKRRIVESGVLDRFEDKHGPNVLVEADPPSS